MYTLLFITSIKKIEKGTIYGGFKYQLYKLQKVTNNLPRWNHQLPQR